MQLTFSRVYLKFKIIFFLLFSPLVSAADLDPESKMPSTQTGMYKDYIIKFAQGESPNVVLNKLSITRQGKDLFTMEGVQNIRSGTDLKEIGDLNIINSPLLIVDDYSGGAHCCYSTTILKLHPDFKILATFEGKDSEVEIEKLSSPDSFRVRLKDWSYAYKWTSFAGSHAPEIVLHLVGDTVSVAHKEMVKKPLNSQELNHIIQDINSTNYPDFEYYPLEQQKEELYFSKLLKPVLDLIYSGNTEQAQQIIDQTWPGDEASKERFMSDLKQALLESNYYNDIAELNKS